MKSLNDEPSTEGCAHRLSFVCSPFARTTTPLCSVLRIGKREKKNTVNMFGKILRPSPKQPSRVGHNDALAPCALPVSQPVSVSYVALHTNTLTTRLGAVNWVLS